MFILMASDVLEFPGEFACGYLLPNFVYQVVVGLFWCVVLMHKDSCQSGFAVASKLYSACLYVVKDCNGFCHYYDSKDASKFAPIGIDFVWMSWRDVSAGDAVQFTVPVL